MILAIGVPKGRVLKVLGTLENREMGEKIINDTLAKFGRIDVLVGWYKCHFILTSFVQINNAASGKGPHINDILEIENCDFIYDVNFRRFVWSYN
jgi:hypothetical protein